MKLWILLTLFISTTAFAQGILKGIENLPSANELQINTEKLPETNTGLKPSLVVKKDPFADFDLGSTLSNQSKFKRFIVDSISIIEIESPKEIDEAISGATKGLVFHRLVSNSELLSTFLYQAMQAPEAIASLFSIYLQKNALILFSAAMILSFIFSHYLGELKFNFAALSFGRMSYSMFRFTLMNGLRLWLFTFLFSDNLKPISNVFMNSLDTVQVSYPNLYKASIWLTTFVQ